MLWTLVNKKPGTNTINQITMGLIFMNLSVFAMVTLHHGKGAVKKFRQDDEIHGNVIPARRKDLLSGGKRSLTKKKHCLRGIRIFKKASIHPKKNLWWITSIILR